MICRLQVKKAFRWFAALTIIVSGIGVCCLIPGSIAAIGVGVIMIGGGISIANANCIDDDIRYRRQYV